jgi:phytoene desaturase
MSTNKAIVVGSGIAGMATAIRLAVKGYSVDVYEKNATPGGKLTFFEQDGFKFDAGPSLFTQPQNIVDLFTLASAPIEKYFTYQSVDIACKYFYENGKIVNAYTQREKFAAELESVLGESPKAIDQYLSNAEKLYKNVGTVFLNHSLHRSKTWLHKRTWQALRTVKAGYLFRSLHRHNQQQFKHPETVQLFNRYATYNGSNPYKAPSMLSLIPHLEMNEGTFYPQGGMISITNALYQLAIDKGVQFHFNAPVQRIIQHQGKVQGVVVNNQNIDAQIVVSNADVYYTYKLLLQNEFKAKQVLKQERSSSAIIFYWGINRSFPELHLHNIFFSKDYATEFDAIFNKGKLSNDNTVYINITSKMEATQAPAGKENWFVMVNAPAHRGQDWDQIKATAKAAVIEKLSNMLGTNISVCIETEKTLDPQLIESQTASYMGSLYGTSSNSKFAAFLRHPNFTTNIKGLYCCGGSVHPGGGIPLCLKSAQIVGDLIAAPQPQHH